MKSSSIMTKAENEYQHNGKTVKILRVGRKKKSEDESTPSAGRSTRTRTEPGQSKYAVGNKVGLKNIPIEYAGAGFAESVVVKVFKSSHDQNFRYTIRGSSGQELAMVTPEQLKPYK